MSSSFLVLDVSSLNAAISCLSIGFCTSPNPLPLSLPRQRHKASGFREDTSAFQESFAFAASFRSTLRSAMAATKTIPALIA